MSGIIETNNDNSDGRVIGDEFWLNQPSILINKERLFEIFPSNDMTFEEKLNAVVRLALYYSIMMWLFMHNSIHLYVLIFVLALTVVIYKYQDEIIVKLTDKQIIEQLDPSVTINKDNIMIDKDTQEFCMKPTANNAFGNVLLSDYVDQPNRPQACSIDNPEIVELTEQYFDDGLYKNADDIFNNKNSQRQFFTNPSTTIPNDRETFTDFCFSNMKSCRGGDSDKCYRYEDLRSVGGAGIQRLV